MDKKVMMEMDDKKEVQTVSPEIPGEATRSCEDCGPDNMNDSSIFAAFQSGIESSMRLVECMSVNQRNLALATLQKILASHETRPVSNISDNSIQSEHPMNCAKECGPLSSFHGTKQEPKTSPANHCAVSNCSQMESLADSGDSAIKNSWNTTADVKVCVSEQGTEVSPIDLEMSCDRIVNKDTEIIANAKRIYSSGTHKRGNKKVSKPKLVKKTVFEPEGTKKSIRSERTTRSSVLARDGLVKSNQRPNTRYQSRSTLQGVSEQCKRADLVVSPRKNAAILNHTRLKNECFSKKSPREKSKRKSKKDEAAKVSHCQSFGKGISVVKTDTEQPGKNEAVSRKRQAIRVKENHLAVVDQKVKVEPNAAVDDSPSVVDFQSDAIKMPKGEMKDDTEYEGHEHDEDEVFSLYVNISDDLGDKQGQNDTEDLSSEIKEKQDCKKVTPQQSRRVHTCSSCGLEFPTKSKLLGHMQTHWDVKCEQCLRMFQSERSLQRHAMLVHPVKTEDSKSVNGVEELKHQCGECGKFFNRQSNLEAHVIGHTDAKRHSCIYCGRVFAFHNNLTRHLMLHTGERPHPCEHCDARFIEKRSLLTHMERKHGVPGSLREKRTYTCAVCNKLFNSSGTLQQHMLVHTGEKNFACTICGKGFSLNSNRKRHERCHTGKRPFQCSDCGKTFTEKQSLEVHRRQHTGERPYKCKICGRGFSQAGTLASHMPVHNKQRNLLCTLCGMSFLRRSHLTFHMKKHNEPPKYQCTECPQAFYRNFDLVRHRQTHDQMRPYPCLHCLKRFSRKAYLTKHLLSHTENRVFPCTRCTLVFENPGERYRHARTAHPRTRPTPITVLKQELDQQSVVTQEIPVNVQNLDGSIRVVTDPDSSSQMDPGLVQFTVTENGKAVFLNGVSQMESSQHLGSAQGLDAEQGKIPDNIAVSVTGDGSSIFSKSANSDVHEMFAVTDTGLVTLKPKEVVQGENQLTLSANGSPILLSETDRSTQAVLEETVVSKSSQGHEVHVQTIDLEQGVSKTYVLLVKND